MPLLLLAGLLLLGLSQPQHYKALVANPAPPQLRRRLRVGGWLLLAVSLYLTVAQYRWWLGLSWWFGNLTLCALLVAAGFTAAKQIRNR